MPCRPFITDVVVFVVVGVVDGLLASSPLCLSNLEKTSSTFAQIVL